MHRFRSCAAAIVLSFGVCTCSKSSEAPALAAAPPPTPSTSDANAATGRVDGTVPAPSGGSIIVVLEPRTERAFPPQDEKPVMDQVGQTFGPDLLIVRTAQPVEFRNSDDTLHNVHVTHDETHEAAFNVAIPTGASYTYSFRRDGFYRVGCDIHPSMAASIFATASPFAVLAGPDGRFAFEEVPTGAWRVSVYAAGRQLQRDIDVHGGTNTVAVE